MLMLVTIILAIVAFDVLLWINVHSFNRTTSEKEGVAKYTANRKDKP